MNESPFHITHCTVCKGEGEVKSLAKPGLVLPCLSCEGTGHVVLPFHMEVTLESEYLTPRGGQNGNPTEG